MATQVRNSQNFLRMFCATYAVHVPQDIIYPAVEFPDQQRLLFPVLVLTVLVNCSNYSLVGVLLCQCFPSFLELRVVVYLCNVVEELDISNSRHQAKPFQGDLSLVLDFSLRTNIMFQILAYERIQCDYMSQTTDTRELNQVDRIADRDNVLLTHAVVVEEARLPRGFSSSQVYLCSKFVFFEDHSTGSIGREIFRKENPWRNPRAFRRAKQIHRDYYRKKIQKFELDSDQSYQNT